MTQTTSTATNTTQVAGEKGAGVPTDVAGASGGGGTADIAAALAPLLEQLTQVITSLVQALSGAGLVAGTTGGGMAGMDMSGCDMGGDAAVTDATDGHDALGGKGDLDPNIYPTYQVPVSTSDVDGESGEGVDKVVYTGGDDVTDVAGESGEGAGKAVYKGDDDVTDVAGESGEGAGKAVYKGDDDVTDVAGENGDAAPGKGDSTDVGGVKGDPSQDAVDDAAVAKAQAQVDALAPRMKAAQQGVTTATDRITSAKGKVTAARAAVDAARNDVAAAKVDVATARAALVAARTSHGTHVANGSQTLEDIARRYGVSVDRLKKLNPSISGKGAIIEGTEVKLPKGVGTDEAVAKAQKALSDAKDAQRRAEKALEKSIADLRAAREAVRQAERDLARAKEQLAAAQKAMDEAEKALAAAKAGKAAVPAPPAKDAEHAGKPIPKQRYTVQAGDTRSSIARHFNVSARALVLANPKKILSDGKLAAGTVLTIPSGVAAFDAAKASKWFGMTLKEYHKRFAVEPGEFAPPKPPDA